MGERRKEQSRGGRREGKITTDRGAGGMEMRWFLSMGKKIQPKFSYHVYDLNFEVTMSVAGAMTITSFIIFHGEMRNNMILMLYREEKKQKDRQNRSMLRNGGSTVHLWTIF